MGEEDEGSDPANPGRGRPTKYKTEYIEQVQKLCQLGATDDEIADFLNISLSTFKLWRNKYPDLSAAVKIAKEAADARVERSLFQRATGYKADAVKIFMPAGAVEPVYAPYRENVQPDVTAQIFWLKNRKSKEWRDRQDHEHHHKIDIEDRLRRALKRKPDAAEGSGE